MRAIPAGRPRIRPRRRAPILSLAKARANPELPPYLESLIQEAETGRLQSVLVVCVYSDGDVGHGWCAHRSVPYNAIIGEVETAKARLLIRCDDALRMDMGFPD